MADYILVAGDKVLFLPFFGPAIVVTRPGKIQGSGAATLTGKKFCVVGDEEKVSVTDCMYITPQYCIPGKGTLKIAALAPDQRAKKTKTGDKAVLLKGTLFTAKFEVQTPAKQPPPGPGAPIPDPMPMYAGRGLFRTTNAIFRGA